MEQLRTCKQCGQTKPLETGFHKQAKAVKAGGYRVVCKECANQYSRDKYKTPEGHQARLESYRKWAESDLGQKTLKERSERPEEKARQKAYYLRRQQQPLQMEGTKTCSTCGVEKPVTEFYEMATGKGRRAGECKPCYKERVKRYQANQGGDNKRPPTAAQ